VNTRKIKKSEVLCFDISEDVFSSDCHIFIGREKAALISMNKHLKKHYPKEDMFTSADLSGCHGVAIQFKGYRISYLWLPSIPKVSAEHGTLAHEFCHITIHYFHQMEFPIDKGHDEPICYFMKFLIMTFWDKVGEWQEKTNKIRKKK